jgi:hypothetical protein
MVHAVLVAETLRATSLPPHLFVVFVVPDRTFTITVQKGRLCEAISP